MQNNKAVAFHFDGWGMLFKIVGFVIRPFYKALFAWWLPTLLSRLVDWEFGKKLERAIGGLLMKRGLRRVPNEASDYRKTGYNRGVLATFVAPDLKLQVEMSRGDIVLYGAPVSGKRGWGRLGCDIPVPATRQRPGYYRDLVEDDIPDLGRLLDERWNKFVAEVNVD